MRGRAGPVAEISFSEGGIESKESKTLFIQRSPFSSKAGLDKGPISSKLITQEILYAITFKNPMKIQ